MREIEELRSISMEVKLVVEEGGRYSVGEMA